MANVVNPNSNSGQGQENSGNEPLDLGQSRYDFRSLVFPNDLGMDDNGHYMIININVPSDPDRTQAKGILNRTFSTPLTGQASKVDRLRFGPSGSPRGGFTAFGVTAGGATSNAGGPGTDRPFFAIQRRTMRIAESIALHMPTPLIYNTHNAYEEISLTALGFKLGTQALTTAVNQFLPRSTSRALNPIISGAGQAITTASKLMQSPINPAVEILFANTPVRQFTLEVMMAPRNEKESISMKDIIKTLRFHAAPEISDTFGGLFWIPPAEFDVTFFNKGVENMNILRMNTCVLERIEVDYSPTGVYSTFRNGHPVAARLSLGFRELEPIHKKRVLQGF